MDQRVIDQIADGAARGQAHVVGHRAQLVEVIVDDRLTGDAEHLTVGGQADFFATVIGGDVLVFSPWANFTQARKRPHADPGRHLEVTQAALFGPQVIGLRRLVPAEQDRLGGAVHQDVAEVAGVMGERQADHGHRIKGGH
ncbi:hypothetical protein D3C85_1284790 [compost metagenome]